MDNFDERKAHELADMSELQIANKAAVSMITLICSIISIAYVAEVLKGSRKVLYVAITVVLAMIPVVSGWIVYSKNHTAAFLKYVLSISYCIMYGFVLFTANNDLVFTYAIPLMIITMLFEDSKYRIGVGAVVVVENIAAIIIAFVRGGVTEKQIVNFEIQGLVKIGRAHV